MTDIETLVGQGESANLELKTSLADWKKIVETVAAMATVGGGRILVGVRPAGEICGVALPEGAQERIIQRVLGSTDPRVYVSVSRHDVDGKAVLSIDVPAGDGPHLAFGRAFHRPGPATVQLSRAEYERRLLDRLRETSGWELRPATGCDAEDLDEERVEHFRRQAHLPEASARDVLRGLKLMDGERPTHGAVVLFGRRVQDAIPQAVVRGRVVRSSPVGPHAPLAADALDAEGTLFDQVEASLHFVERNLRQVAYLPAGSVRRVSRPELPLAAVREVILNAVAHRDYRSTAPTQIRLGPDALEVWNPGHLPEPLTIAMLRGPHPSVPTNPRIARAFQRLGYIEEWGSGTLRVIDAMASQGNPAPIFSEEAGGIRVQLPMAGSVPAGLNARQAAWLGQHTVGTVFKTADYASVHSVTSRTALSDLTELAALGLARLDGAGPSSRWVIL